MKRKRGTYTAGVERLGVVTVMVWQGTTQGNGDNNSNEADN